MKTVIKRHLTNGSTAKTSFTKSSSNDGLATKVRNKTKKAFLRGSHGSTALWQANRRWRKALAYYVNVPGEQVDEPTIEADQGKLIPQKEEGTPEDDHFDFHTFDNAPKVDRFGLSLNLGVVWANQLPGGLERLVCILMAIFLFLSILSVQIYVSTLSKHRIRCRLSFCEKPSSLTEVITFECRVALLIVAWVASMLIAWIVLACHFLFWCCTFRRPNSPGHFEEGPENIAEDDLDAHKHLDSIVTEGATTEDSQLSMGHKKED